MNKHKGFTIVELLVVIVVIGILAGITVIAYGGVQKRAKDSARGLDVSQFKKLIEIKNIETGSYVCTDCTTEAQITTTYKASNLIPSRASAYVSSYDLYANPPVFDKNKIIVVTDYYWISVSYWSNKSDSWEVTAYNDYGDGNVSTSSFTNNIPMYSMADD